MCSRKEYGTTHASGVTVWVCEHGKLMCLISKWIRLFGFISRYWNELYTSIYILRYLFGFYLNFFFPTWVWSLLLLISFGGNFLIYLDSWKKSNEEASDHPMCCEVVIYPFLSSLKLDHIPSYNGGEKKAIAPFIQWFVFVSVRAM